MTLVVVLGFVSEARAYTPLGSLQHDYTIEIAGRRIGFTDGISFGLDSRPSYYMHLGPYPCSLFTEV
jgi:hypothetical protein